MKTGFRPHAQDLVDSLDNFGCELSLQLTGGRIGILVYKNAFG
jgi:hypothetical protein